jgi:hypothetical protein
MPLAKQGKLVVGNYLNSNFVGGLIRLLPAGCLNNGGWVATGGCVGWPEG